MRKFLLIGIFYLLSLSLNAQVVSLNAIEIDKLKKLIQTDLEVKNHWEIFRKTADESLSAIPNPADTILSEGILQGDPRKTKTWKSLEDMPKIYALGLAYKVTNEQQYLDKAVEFLIAWAMRNQPQGNPINDTNLDRLIFAYDLLKTDLKIKDNILIKAWLNEVLKQEFKTLKQAKANKGSSKSFNNWHSHRIKIITQIATALDSKDLKNGAIQLYTLQIAQNLKSDGSSFDFHERDALHYHIYDVDPLLVTATILTRDPNIKGNFYEYLTKEGNSLKKSIDWLVPYFTGEKTHAEFVNSKAAFDKKRAENGEKGYIAGSLFKPSEARTSIALAGFFDQRMLQIYQGQIKNRTKYPVWQFVLNELRR